MAGKGMKSLSEAMRGLSLAAQPCRTLPVRFALYQPLSSQLTISTSGPGPASVCGVQEVNGNRRRDEAFEHHTIRQRGVGSQYVHRRFRLALYVLGVC
jgi:hypothetical protein